MKKWYDSQNQFADLRTGFFRISIGIILWIFCQMTLPAPLIYEIGDVHKPSIRLIRGQWIVEGSRFLFKFTNQPVKKINIPY